MTQWFTRAGADLVRLLRGFGIKPGDHVLDWHELFANIARILNAKGRVLVCIQAPSRQAAEANT